MQEPAPLTPSDAPSLFQGDTGTLKDAQRRTLVNILRKRYISADTSPVDWAEIVTNPHVYQTRLSDMFLTLEIDIDHGVAYKQQAVAEVANGFPTLLHDAPYNREQTVALVHLREQYHVAISAGHYTAFIQHEELKEHVELYRDRENSNQVRGARQVDNAIEYLETKVKVLLPVKDVPGRYRISPIIELLMPVTQMRVLLAWLRGDNLGTTSANEEAAL